MKKPKVIILIPTYNHAPLLWDTLRYLDKLDPQPSKYIFFENNSTDNTLDVIRKFNHPKEIIKMWFRDDAVKVLGNAYAMIGTIRQYLLKRARQLDPDYVIFVDDDVILFYPHFIEQIIGRKKDIVHAPYLRSYVEGVNLSAKWKRKGMKGVWYKSSCKGFQEAYAVSMGCTCLSRRIIQDRRVNFLPIIWNENGKKASEDFGYCIRARKFGYTPYVDCVLQVGHYLDTYYYKPWLIKMDKEGKDIGYIDFKYGKEEELRKEILS